MMKENLGNSRRIALNECQKVFVQRDYSLGCSVMFDNTFPPELEDRIDPQTWADFIHELNQIYANAAEVNSKSVAECLLGFFTCYLSHLCVKSLWERRLKEADEYIDDANNQIFVRRGLYVSNPMVKGLRVLEIVLLNEPMNSCPAKTSPDCNGGSLPPLQPR